MAITHNYAPTASFKTMVDGQGNVTKAFYRKLERSEEEGTRCPTTYDLFKLFTSKYPMTPEVVEDQQRNPMTITRRFHRFLVDKVDGTPTMIERARTCSCRTYYSCAVIRSDIRFSNTVNSEFP
jgi:hypothetical protein